MEYEEMKQIVATQVCAQCGGELTIHSNVDTGKLGVWCPYHPDHHGYVERETYTQALRRGEEVHPAIRDKIERKMILPGGQPVEVALSMIQTRFPRADMDEPSAALFLWDCVRLDLDPLLGEIFPATFKTKAKDGTEKKVVQPLNSEDGWLSLAARSCAKDWAGPPRTMRLEEHLQMQDAYKEKPYTEVKEIAKEIKADLCKDPEAYVWVAIGHRKDEDDTITYGWYKKSEEGVVAKNLPGNQARVRAIKRWVRETFPEAKAKMKEMTATWMDRAGDVRDIQKVIEAEYHIVTEEPPSQLKGDKKIGEKVGATAPTKIKPKQADWRAFWEQAEQLGLSQKQVHEMLGVASVKEWTDQGKTLDEAIEAISVGLSEPATDEVAGEGFSIDLTWLKESQKTLKWSDDTILTFIISQYKVSGTSVTGALNKLTREQAEDFVNQINKKLEKQASLF